jgi:hypothetical protein
MAKVSHAKRIQRAHEALDKFLKDFRTSDSGYATYTEQDEENFWNFFRIMLEAKFETDADGDYPMEIRMVNRTYEERLPYFSQRYLYRMETLNEVAEYIRNAQINLSIAAEDVRLGTMTLQDMIKKS